VNILGTEFDEFDFVVDSFTILLPPLDSHAFIY